MMMDGSTSAWSALLHCNHSSTAASDAAASALTDLVPCDGDGSSDEDLTVGGPSAIASYAMPTALQALKTPCSHARYCALCPSRGRHLEMTIDGCCQSDEVGV